MENLIDYEFTPKIKYYFKYEVETETSKEQIIQVNLLNSYIEEKDGKKELIIEEDKETKLTDDTYKVGYYLRDLLNIYKYALKKSVISYRKILNKSIKIERLENGEIISINLLREFKDFLDEIMPNYSPIFNVEIINCLWYMEYHIPKYIGLLYAQVERIKSVSHFDDSCQSRINQLQEQINILESKDFFDKQCLKCIDDIIKNMDEVVEFVNNAFYMPEKAQKFKGVKLNIPNHEVEYKETKTLPKPTKYMFKFHNLKELMAISIYMFDKVHPIRVINICKECEDYFIPDKSTTCYCNNVKKVDERGNNITCEDIGKAKAFGNKEVNTDKDNTNSNLYHRIYNRPKSEEEQIEFTNGYYDICDKYKNDEERLEIEKCRYLMESNKKYRKDDKGKRGRPYKD